MSYLSFAIHIGKHGVPFTNINRTICQATCFLVLWLALMLPLSALAKAVEPGKAYNFYLTEGRVCNHCTWQWYSATQVQLTNPQGVSGVYLAKEIYGANTHPIRRWLYRKHLDGLWLPAKVIVPSAYDDRSFLEFPDPPFE